MIKKSELLLVIVIILLIMNFGYWLISYIISWNKNDLILAFLSLVLNYLMVIHRIIIVKNKIWRIKS